MFGKKSNDNGEKLYRYSIRKYHFGAASVAVAALMFFANGAVKADTLPVSPVTANTEKVNAGVTGLTEGVPPKEHSIEKSKEVEGDKTTVAQKTVDKSPLVQAISELQAAIAKVDEESLLSLSNQLSQLTDENKRLLDGEDISEEALTRQVIRVQSLTEQVRQLKSKTEDKTSNKEDRADSKAQKTKELKVSDKAVIPTNQTEEIKAVQKDDNKEEGAANKDKLESLSKSLITYLDAAKKIERPETKKLLEGVEEIVRSVENGLVNSQLTASEIEELMKQGKQAEKKLALAVARENSGKRDSRNGQRIGQGTGERAATVSSRWNTQDNLLIYQRFRATDGSGNRVNDNRQFTENKVDMTAQIQMIEGHKYLVYDVFFNNDGKSMVVLSKQQLYNVILPPKILDLQPNGLYKPDTIRALHFDMYRRINQNEGGTLSQNPDKFRYESTEHFHFINDRDQSKGRLTYLYNLGVRQNGSSYDQDMKEYFKNNKNDQFLKDAVALDGVNKQWAYGIGVRTNDATAAVHMHFEAKLRSDVTNETVQKAFTLAIAGTYGATTSQSYVFGSGKKDGEYVEPTVKQSVKYPISGREVIKTVGDSLGNVSDPVASGFVVRNNNTTSSLNDVRWSWTNGRQPNTSTAGIFTYSVTAHYYDNSSNSATVTLKVKPKTPEIDPSSVNEKAGQPRQNVVVTVHEGVPEGSTVILYNGTNIIGRGRTTGQKAIINVVEALPSTSITAKTIVGNNSEVVESDLSDPVKPTEVPDKQPPTVLLNGKRLTTNADENQFIIYRGAAFNPTFNVTDESRIGSLMVRNLPKGVYFNKVNNVDKELVGTSTTLNHTISDDDSNKVADDATLGEQIAFVEASDRYGNSATYKFKYRIVDIQAKNSTTENRTVGSTLGNPKNNFKVAESDTVENNKYYPDGMQFKWKEIDLRNARITDVANGTQLNELGTITKYTATAVFPGVKNTKEIDRVNYTIYSPTQKAIPITFNVKPNAPTISQPQFNGTAGTRPNVTVGNLPTNAQLQNGATVTVELYQGTTKVASKTVTDRNGTTTLSAENFTDNLTEGQQVHAVVKVSGGQGATAYSVNSDNSENRDVTGYNLVARDIINVKQGERLTQDELNKLIQVQEGNTLQDLPQGATVTATLDTATIANGGEETKTAEATVDFGQGRTKKLNIRYRVLRTFPVANLVYDFHGQPRGDNEASYYSNTRGLPSGMDWYLKKGNQNQPTSKIQDYLKNDPIGSTEYTFGAKYNAGRFTNSPKADDKLKHEGSLIHKVFDVMPNPTKVTVDQGASLSDKQAKDAVIKVANSENLPEGTTYEWVNASGVRENARATTSGKQTFHVKITLPKSQVTGSDLPGATQVQPSKTIAVTVNVTPPKPTFDSNKVTSTSRTITGTLGGLNANSSNTVVSVALNDGTNRVLTSENNGGVRINGNTWTATLPDDVKLRTSVAKNGETTQPRGLTVTTKIKGSTTADDISVTSDVKAVEMGDYSVNATIAGSKHIDVKVPHDAKRMELRFHNSTESSNTPKSIVLVRGADGTWHTDATRANNTAVANANGYVGRISSTVSTTNPAENNIRIALNEQSGTAKLHIKEESANGDNTESYGSGLGLRVYNQPEAGQDPSAAGKWKVTNVTNTKPTLSYKGTEASNVDARKVFPSGTSITKAMLENLVTVGDREDKVTNEADKPYGTPTIKIVSGLTETPGKATASGSYAVVLKAVDSQGKESDPLTVYVGVVSTVLKYQPKVGTEPKGDPIAIAVGEGEHHQGEVVTYKPKEITVGDKVYVPVQPEGNSVTLTDKPQTVDVAYKEKPSTSTPTFTVGTQNPQTGNVEVTVDGVPEGTKVKLPGIASEKVVTGGKVELTNNELPENPTTGKGIAQEDGKLPKEGTSDITIPGKLTSAKGEPAREFEVTIPLPLVVPDPEHLTPKEIEKLVDKVKESNPNTIVTADDKGNVTVTDKTTGDSALIPVKDLTVKDFEPVKPTEKVPVKDKSHLTPEEKKQVADKVKDKNPGKEVTVGDDGTATVTDPTTGISHTIPGTDLVTQDFEPVKPTEKVPVKDKSHLTPEEKKQVADKVKDKNPGKEVTVGDDGTATVTDPTTGISHTIPGTDIVTQDFEPVKPTEKVPVKDKVHLTPEEKKQVADKVKDKNPGKEVTVGDDGTATVTDPTTGISHTIPGTELVNQDFELVKPTDKVPVKDKSDLTPEEKKQVADKVKDKNPGKEVTVGDDGTATVTDPTTGVSHTIPGTDLVNQDFEPVKPSEKVPVKDKSHLTPEEKKQVADKVKDKNPGKEVTVGDDGTATVKDPTTGISHTIPGTDLVNQDFEPVKPTEKVPVKDPSNLTKEEQDKVKKAVEKANPGKDVTVDSKGNATVKDPRTKISHEIPNKDLVMVTGKGDSTKLDLPSLIITKWVDENGNELKPADVKAPTVLGEANEAFEHGEIEGYVFVRTETKGDVVTHVFRKVSPARPTGDGQQRPATPSADTNRRPDTAIPAEVPVTQPTEQPSQTVEVPAQLSNEVSETDSSVSQPQTVLPNTGTQEDRATGALGVLSLLGTFGLLAAKKKKDDEEEA